MFLLQKNLSHEDILKLARGEKHWTDPDVVAALAHFEELVHKGYLGADAATHDQSTGRALYFKGQGAFWQAGSWHLFTKGTPDMPPEWEYRFIPFPGFAETSERNVAISTVNWNWAISEHSHHKEEALLFLDYITRPEIAELWVSTLHWFLTIRGAVNERTASPEMLAITQYLESAIVVPGLEHLFHRQVVQDGHWKGARDVLSGKLTTQQWAERIEERQKASGVLPLDRSERLCES
jgi:raffinose/stachyose/melibiose transport system substrate-binding protein